MTKVSRKEKAIHKGYSVLSVRSTLDAVMIARRIHLYPYRTQKLSSLALMILGGRPPGKVGRCRFSKKATCKDRLLFSRKRIKRDSGAIVKYFIAKQKHRAAYKLFGTFEYISITDESMMSLPEKALIRSFTAIFMINIESCA